MQLQRLIQKDIFAASNLAPTQGGDSEIITLNYGDRLSVQSFYDVSSPSAKIVASASINFSTDTWTSNAHGFTTGLVVQLTTSGALPTPLQLTTNYYVIVLSANTFKLAASLSDALAGTPIDLDDAGTGNQTVTPVALAGASVGYYLSNVEEGDYWTLINTATSITVDGSSYLAQPDVAYRRFKAVKSLTSGIFTLQSYVLVIGGTA